MFRTRTTTTLLVTALFLSALAMAGYAFLFLSIASTNRSVSALENEVDLVTQKESKLRSIEKSIRETEEDRTRLASYLISEGGIVSFIETIEGFEVVTGAVIDIKSVDVGAVSSAAPDADATTELIRLSFSAVGTWQEVVHTLALLETLPVSLEISRATLRVSGSLGDGEEEASWSSAITLSAVKKK